MFRTLTSWWFQTFLHLSLRNGRWSHFWSAEALPSVWHNFSGQNAANQLHDETPIKQSDKGTTIPRWINSTLTECIQSQAVRCFSNAKRADSGGLAPGQCRPCRVYQLAFGKRWVDTLVAKVSDKADVASINHLFLRRVCSFQLLKQINALLIYCNMRCKYLFAHKYANM